LQPLFALILVFASQALAQSFGIQKFNPSDFPLNYIQSGFAAGGQWAPVGMMTPDYDSKVRWAKVLAKKFGGSEILITDTTTAAARNDIRQLSDALRQVSTENGKSFFGYYVVPRPPGFHFSFETDRQPPEYRSQILRSDGALMTRHAPSDIQSFIAVTGYHLDITNEQAFNDFMTNTKRVFNASCSPTDDCVGPLYGFIAFNENKLTEVYTPFQPSPSTEPDLQDYWPIHWEKEDIHDRYERLRGGHPFDLMVDGDPAFSFLVPPKRVIPLFSKSAAESFRRFAQDKGFTHITKLPADRNEFNDLETDFNGEPRLKLRPGDPLGPDGWVQFVPLSDTEYWSVWEDWVYKTWGDFLKKLAQAFAEGQAGNNDYKGAIYFQLPIWFSIRGSLASSPTTYSYKDADGTIHQKTLSLSDDPLYKSYNPVGMGADLDDILQSPYIAGVVHETTNALPIYVPRTTETLIEEEVYNSPVHHHLFLAKGQIAKTLCQKYGKIFGAFARYDMHVYGGQLSQDAYRSFVWDRTLDLMAPQMVSTLPTHYYLTDHDLEGSGVLGAATESESVSFGEIWLKKLTELKKLLLAPPLRRRAVKP